MAEFKKCFLAIDTENTGVITVEDLRSYMIRNNYKDAFVTKWIKLFDPHNSGVITFDTYCRTLGLIPRRHELPKAEQTSEISSGSDEKQATVTETKKSEESEHVKVAKPSVSQALKTPEPSPPPIAPEVGTEVTATAVGDSEPSESKIPKEKHPKSKKSHRTRSRHSKSEGSEHGEQSPTDVDKAFPAQSANGDKGEPTVVVEEEISAVAAQKPESESMISMDVDSNVPGAVGAEEKEKDVELKQAHQRTPTPQSSVESGEDYYIVHAEEVEHVNTDAVPVIHFEKTTVQHGSRSEEVPQRTNEATAVLTFEPIIQTAESSVSIEAPSIDAGVSAKLVPDTLHPQEEIPLKGDKPEIEGSKKSRKERRKPAPADAVDQTDKKAEKKKGKPITFEVEITKIIPQTKEPTVAPDTVSSGVGMKSPTEVDQDHKDTENVHVHEELVEPKKEKHEVESHKKSKKPPQQKEQVKSKAKAQGHEIETVEPTEAMSVSLGSTLPSTGQPSMPEAVEENITKLVAEPKAELPKKGEKPAEPKKTVKTKDKPPKTDVTATKSVPSGSSVEETKDMTEPVLPQRPAKTKAPKKEEVEKPKEFPSEPPKAGKKEPRQQKVVEKPETTVKAAVKEVGLGKKQAEPKPKKAVKEVAEKEGPAKPSAEEPGKVKSSRAKKRLHGTTEEDKASGLHKPKSKGAEKQKPVDGDAHPEESDRKKRRRAFRKERMGKDRRKRVREPKPPGEEKEPGTEKGPSPRKRVKKELDQPKRDGRFPRAFMVQPDPSYAENRRELAIRHHRYLVRKEMDRKEHIERKPKRRLKIVERWRVRESLRTRGVIVILLAGRHRGKRVVCLGRQGSSGLLLVTGPYQYNGCPLRRVHPKMVIATKTRIKLGKFVLPKRIHRKDYFARTHPNKHQKLDDAALLSADSDKKLEYKPDEKRIEDQKVIDEAVCKAIKAHEEPAMLVRYLKSLFSLGKHDRPHSMVF
ncbi:unnamed protein product [Calicophoron daubneyi]|uniref:Large ribosomal subunit protein eL6 n=1 Tax=Calicophoron daubneyi TaxID=300641 RepID=A0AAV2SYE2_CALDB